MVSMHEPGVKQERGEGLPASYRSTVAMDTIITVSVESARPASDLDAALERALAWFSVVEQTCSRFDPASELVRLCSQPGCAIPVSAMLFEAIRFAVEVARLTHGAFDPTVGGAQQARGFNRSYITRATLASVQPEPIPVSYRDVRLDARRRTIALRRPLLLDLGAVAKGLAIDLAARELAGLERFAVEAGGDLFAGGSATPAAPWRIGVRNPEHDGLLGSLSVWNRAVCTSGGYERPLGNDGEHHLLDPRTGRSPRGVISLTSIAPTAMVADALGTAAFILGPAAGLRLLGRNGVEGILALADHQLRITPGCTEDLQWSEYKD